MHKILFFLFCWLTALNASWAQSIKTDINGPIHEAFAARITEETSLQAVLNQPPEPVQEKAPRHQDPLAAWIPGYWEWSDDTHNFIWVSGIWRKPPPDMQWIAGDWQKFDEGWARVKGFWSNVPEDALTFIDSAPPDQQDEKAGNPPDNNYFWLPGYWSYNEDQNDFEWLKGRWEPLDPNWVIVPAHYVWRDKGYAFISPYWDWPIDRRGQIYAATHFSLPMRSGIIYEPVIVLSLQNIVNVLFFDYPNYSCLFYHYYCYHPDFWRRYPYTPPWWGWRTWWTFSWHHCWGLWWWYGHPGYPAPGWMTTEMSAKLPPPHADFVARFKGVKGPPIITPRGVVTPSEYRSALKEYYGKGKKFIPVASSNVKTKEKIDAVASKKIKEEKHFEPSGKKGEISPKAQEVKPPIQQPEMKIKAPASKNVKTPVKPVKDVKPSIEEAQQRHPQYSKPIQPEPPKELKNTLVGTKGTKGTSDIWSVCPFCRFGPFGPLSGGSERHQYAGQITLE